MPPLNRSAPSTSGAVTTQTSCPPAWAMLMGNLAIVPATITVLLVLIAFANPIQPVTDSRVSSTNPMLLFRLSIAAMAWVVGIWGVVQSRDVRELLKSPPGLATACLAGLFLITSAFAIQETALISRAAALIFVGYFLFITTALATVGLGTVVRSFLVGSTCYLLVAWIAYLLFPSFGQFYEYTDATTTVTRMGGLAHPNAIAAEASVALIVCFAVMRDRRQGHSIDQWSKLGWALLMMLIFATLYATMSRTAVLAVIAALVMLMFDKLYGRRGVLILVGAVTLGLGSLSITMLTTTESVSDSAVAAVTKSNNVEELTSLTGRTDIWAEAISLILERPLTGYGLDSAASVMSEKSVGTHNLFLNVVFSTGVITGIFMLLLLGATLYLAFASRNPLFRGIATFVLISGLVDDTLFASFPCPITFLWIAMLLSMTPPDRWRMPAATPVAGAH